MNTLPTAADPDRDASSAGERALSLDDDPDMLESAEMVLTREGFHFKGGNDAGGARPTCGHP